MTERNMLEAAIEAEVERRVAERLEAAKAAAEVDRTMAYEQGHHRGLADVRMLIERLETKSPGAREQVTDTTKSIRRRLVPARPRGERLDAALPFVLDIITRADRPLLPIQVLRALQARGEATTEHYVKRAIDILLATGKLVKPSPYKVAAVRVRPAPHAVPATPAQPSSAQAGVQPSLSAIYGASFAPPPGHSG